ncbi:glycoside hydrolase family 128 protein, partial [Saccharata proteae CBS 121410]
LLSLLVLTLSIPPTSATASSKRGLVYVADTKHPTDDNIWVTSSSDLTWYYNYGSTPTQAFVHSSLSFVPMLWGATDSTPADTTFLTTVTNLITSGTTITHALGFNEPDGTTSTGGSALAADVAAAAWIANLEPLRANHNVSLGAPAVTGSPDGFVWLQNFFTACAGKCNPDFVPVHWYGDFEGLASHLGQVMATYPNMSVWVTEFALPNAGLQDTQSFYNESMAYLDRLENVTHYSYFGSFRSSVSNVGPNVAMLNQKGKLTDIGSWYLGGVATDVKPGAGAA